MHFGQRIKVVLGLFILGIFVISCKSDGVDHGYTGSPADVSYTSHELTIQKIQSLDDLNTYITNHPDFGPLFFEQIVPVLNEEEDSQLEAFQQFAQDSFIRHLFDTVQVVFKSFEPIKQEFDRSIPQYQKIFPQAPDVSLHSFISGFAYQQFLFEDDLKDGLGIGLDMYLGGDYPYQSIIPNNTSFSRYITRSFNKDHIVRNGMDLLIKDKVPLTRGDRLLDHMMAEGKKLYLLEQVLNVPDSVLLNFSEAQVQWLTDNETSVWSYFIDKDLLYDTNLRRIDKYISPSPNSPGMPSQAPGRTGSYIGWKIVSAFMARNKNIATDILLKMDAQEILTKSKYRPGNPN